MKTIKDKIIGIIIGLVLASGLVYAAVSQEVLINGQGSNGGILVPSRLLTSQAVTSPGASLAGGGVLMTSPLIYSYATAGYRGVIGGYYAGTTKVSAGNTTAEFNILPATLKIAVTAVSAQYTPGNPSYSSVGWNILHFEAPTANTQDICITISIVSGGGSVACPVVGTVTEGVFIIRPGADLTILITYQDPKTGPLTVVSRSGAQTLYVHAFID